MISEGSCDTEDWNIDAENSANLNSENKCLKYIQIETVIVIIFHNFTVFTVFLIK